MRRGRPEQAAGCPDADRGPRVTMGPAGALGKRGTQVVFDACSMREQSARRILVRRIVEHGGKESGSSQQAVKLGDLFATEAEPAAFTPQPDHGVVV